MRPGQGLGPRFSKSATFGLHFDAWRWAVAIVVVVAWLAASVGRLHPLLVAAVLVGGLAIAFGTINEIALTRWMRLWWRWRRGRNAPAQPAAWSSARDVVVDSGLSIGVLIENETLVTAIELVPNPCAPTVIADDEERTVNTVALSRLAAMLRINDLALSSIDLISTGYRAAGRFADRYQQIIGPVSAAARRDTWIVIRIDIEDNLAALARRGPTMEAAQRAAAVTCQRIANVLARDGIDARPARIAQILSFNDTLQGHPLIADNWSHLASAAGHACIYCADPTHIDEDVTRWWTWPQATDVSTLIRLVPDPAGARLGALVRYRSVTHPKAPPVSRLGSLYGVQKPMWAQFRVGSVPPEAPIPTAPLRDSNIAVPFGPTGQLIGFIGSAAVHMPLVGAVTVLCDARLLLREVALRATITGRPMTVVTDTPELWSRIAECAVSGQVVDRIPEVIDGNTILVVDGECPAELPDLIVLTTDSNRPADLQLVDVEIEPQQYSFTLNTRLGLSARIRGIETHEERSLLI